MAVGLTAPRDYDPSLTFHTYQVPSDGGVGTFIQASIDPLELLYLLGGDYAEEEDIIDDGSAFKYSFSRHGATFGLGYGLAQPLGDRLMVFAGGGWAMAFDHVFDRNRGGWGRNDNRTHLHYDTSGMNLTAGLQWRVSNTAGFEIGYQSFYETVYVGFVFPF